MATIKSFTSLEQSRKLAKILPLESADMVYTIINGYHTPWVRIEKIDELDKDDVCAWSLAALLGVLPDDCCGIDKEDGKYAASYVVSNDGGTYISDNPVDACVAMVEKLHELN